MPLRCIQLKDDSTTLNVPLNRIICVVIWRIDTGKPHKHDGDDGDDGDDDDDDRRAHRRRGCWRRCGHGGRARRVSGAGRVATERRAGELAGLSRRRAGAVAISPAEQPRRASAPKPAPTRRAYGRASRARRREAARQLRGGEPAPQPGGHLWRHRRRSATPTDGTPQTGTRARQTRRRQATRHARQHSDGAHAGTGEATATRRARRQHIIGIARNSHGDGGENGAFDGHDDGQNDRADIANGGRIFGEVAEQPGDGEARSRIRCARAAGERARGTDGGSEERELGHDLTARPRQPPGRRDGGGGETFHL